MDYPERAAPGELHYTDPAALPARQGELELLKRRLQAGLRPGFPARAGDFAELPAQLRDVLEDRVAAGALSRCAVPVRILLVQSLEKTSVGKINSGALRERYGSA